MLSSTLSLAANLERVDGSLGGLGGKLVKEVAGKMITGALHGVAKANIPLLSGACELVGEAVEIVSEFARVHAEMREAAEWLRDQKLLFDGYNEKMQAQESSAAQAGDKLHAALQKAIESAVDELGNLIGLMSKVDDPSYAKQVAKAFWFEKEFQDCKSAFNDAVHQLEVGSVQSDNSAVHVLRVISSIFNPNTTDRTCDRHQRGSPRPRKRVGQGDKEA